MDNILGLTTSLVDISIILLNVISHYIIGKSQMEKSTGHIPPAGPDDDQSSGRKEGYSDHSKGIHILYEPLHEKTNNLGSDQV